jgi:hypothetical protein
MRVRSSWLTVLAATGFNLLFEYSLRGVNHLLAQPLLLPVLFTVYFTLFTMLNDLIARFKLRDYHLMVLAFFFGTFYQFFASGAALLPPLFLGVNWNSILFVVVVWWGIVQSIITFYIANRVAPRDWNHRLSKAGWLIALGLNGLMILVFQRSPAVPKADAQQVAVLVVLMAAAAAVFRLLLPNVKKRAATVEFHWSRTLDALSAITILVFSVCAFLTFDPTVLTTSQVNATAVWIVTRWTLTLAAAVLIYRLVSKRAIPV